MIQSPHKVVVKCLRYDFLLLVFWEALFMYQLFFFFAISYACILFTLSLTDIDECNSNPCRNGGNCTDLVNGYVCKCPHPWKGQMCQSSKNV